MRAVCLAYCFFREALHRVAGIDRRASLATTVFTTAVLTGALLEVAAPVFRVLRPRRPQRPSAVNCMAGVVGVRYAARRIGGEQVRETAFGDAIIVSCLLAPAFKLTMLPVHMAQAAIAALARAWRRYAIRAPA